jgi:hypothetical protein
MMRIYRQRKPSRVHLEGSASSVVEKINIKELPIYTFKQLMLSRCND